MKNKFLLGILVVLIVHCRMEREPVRDIDKALMHEVLQEFSSRRLNLHLYEKKVPPNLDILRMILRERGISFEEFMQKFKNSNGEAFRKIFAGK